MNKTKQENIPVIYSENIAICNISLHQLSYCIAIRSCRFWALLSILINFNGLNEMIFYGTNFAPYINFNICNNNNQGEIKWQKRVLS